VRRCQTVASRLAASSRTLKVGIYVRTGARRFTLPCSTRRIVAVAANVFEIDAMGKTVCPVTGSESSTFVMPSPRVVTVPPSMIPMATPGTPYSFIFVWASETRASKRGLPADWATTGLTPRQSVRASATGTAGRRRMGVCIPANLHDARVPAMARHCRAFLVKYEGQASPLPPNT
jgi:hypothetical protein